MRGGTWGARVLVLNLRMRDDAACARLTEAADPEPLRLTWPVAQRDLPDRRRGRVRLREPSVLIAVADTLGVRARPLVCTNGRPSAAATRLLAGLTAAGVTLHVRADDDAAGQEIVSGLQSAIPGVRLWRFALRSPERPRYEEQDIHELLRDLDRSRTRPSDVTLPCSPVTPPRSWLPAPTSMPLLKQTTSTGMAASDRSCLLWPNSESRQGLLTTVRGIGKWSAEIFLMFQLRRLDVWPTGDLGVRKGYAWHGPSPLPPRNSSTSSASPTVPTAASWPGTAGGPSRSTPEPRAPLSLPDRS